LARAKQWERPVESERKGKKKKKRRVH